MRRSRFAIPVIVASMLSAGLLLSASIATARAPISTNPPRPLSLLEPAMPVAVTSVDGDPAAFWRGFPAAGQWRPIVVLQQLAQINGFTGSDREALTRAIVRADVSLPPAPTGLTLTTAAGTRTVAAVSAAEALRAWRRASGSALDGLVLPRPIHVTHVELGRMNLATDRGRLSVPAWVFRTPAGATLRWPALSPRIFWRDGRARSSSIISAASADAAGTRLTITIDTGNSVGSAADGPSLVRVGADGTSSGDALCHGNGPRLFAAWAEQSGSLVVVTPQTRYTGPPPVLPPGAGCFHLLYAVPRQITVQLSQPLGARVLVGPDGGAVAVIRR